MSTCSHELGLILDTSSPIMVEPQNEPSIPLLQREKRLTYPFDIKIAKKTVDTRAHDQIFKPCAFSHIDLTIRLIILFFIFTYLYLLWLPFFPLDFFFHLWTCHTTTMSPYFYRYHHLLESIVNQACKGVAIIMLEWQGEVTLFI